MSEVEVQVVVVYRIMAESLQQALAKVSESDIGAKQIMSASVMDPQRAVAVAAGG